MPSKKTFHIQGQVRDENTGVGIGGLHVEGCDKDLLVDDSVAEATTEANGVFHLKFEAKRFRELFLDREPDLFFKIYQDGKLVKSTRDSVIWNVKSGDSKIVIEVNVSIPKPEGGSEQKDPLVVRGVVKATDGPDYTLSGRITDRLGQPLAGLTVRAKDQDPKTPANSLGKEALTDADGRYAIRFTDKEFKIGGVESGGPDVFIGVYDDDELLGESPVTRNAKNRIAIDLQVDYVGPDEPRDWVVRGRIVSHELRGLSGRRVVALDKNVGRDVRVGKGTSGNRGAYEILYSAARLKKEKPDIQVQVLDENGEALAASGVRYNAGPQESGLDIVIAAEKLPRPAEYRRLIGELGAHLDTRNEAQLKKRLAVLKEDDRQQDITYLANKTGWDARMVAMTALASQFSERSRIEPEFYYALFRAGVPANEAVLGQMAPETVQQAWERAVEKEILPAELKEKIPQSLERFRAHSAARLLEEPAQVGVSSFKELLRGTLRNAASQKRFARLYYEQRGDLEKFWESVRREFPEAVDRLRLDGKLGFLTINNAPLVQRLHEQNQDLRTPIDLVRRGLYQKEAWERLLGDDVAIPAEIPGEKLAEKKANYAAFMASQLRLSYPTAVVAEMVKTDAIPLHAEQSVKTSVTQFLDKHQGKFELGIHPVEQYLRKNDIALDGPVLAEAKKLQRLYPFSPSEEAMGKLLEHNLDSAYAVVRYDEQTFVSSFKDELGGAAMARLTYAKAHQIHHAVLNITSAYLLQKTALPIYAIDNLAALNGTETVTMALTAEDSGVLPYPTLEAILGEMDYCACEHCRSWLSPAAYLVDVLLFLDRDTEWDAFIANWKADHSNAPYPFLNQAQWNRFQDDWTTRNPGQPSPNTEIPPLEVLLGRRPDIQRVQLTCENTNTVLPYIDLVNEVLEHYVVNGSLAAFTGHDVDGGATTEELLANPQFVNDAAYEELRQNVFPPPLPFHQPLEALRRYFDHFDVPLHEAMEQLRKNDNLERADGPADPAYGWRDILMERLQLSRPEYAVLTDSDLPLQRLYGEDPGAVTVAQLIDRLSNAKSFARLLNLTYEELIEITRTQFINPHSRLIPKLEKLGVDFATLQDSEALLPKELDEAPYGGDVKQWVRDNEAQIMRLIVLSDPTGSEDICSFDTVELRYALPDFANNKLKPVEFLKLLRLIRLWRKMGWSIEHIDKAMAALYPAHQFPAPDDDADTARTKLDAGFQTLILRLAHLQTVMEQLKLTPKRDLTALLACWSPIDAHGHRSLYRQMFLNPTILALDPVFNEDGYGGYLAEKKEFQAPGAEPPKLFAHAEALRAAFNLTQEEFDLILQELGFNNDKVLDLANVSAIFRHGYLARKLRLSVRELLALKSLSGLDPFLPLDLAQPPDPAQPLGSVRPAAIRFIELAQQIKASALKVSQLGYFLRHKDWSGKASPFQESVLALARTLRNDLSRIDREHVVPEDPTGEIARAKMALVYGAEATDIFFGLLNNASPFRVTYNHGQPALEKGILAVTDRIAYDDFQKQLSFRGVMTATDKAALDGADSATDDFRTAVQALFDDGQEVFAAFFERYAELRPLHDAYMFFCQLRTTANYTHGQQTLEKSIVDGSSRRLSYSPSHNQLLFTGVMTAETAQKLKDGAGISAQLKVAVDDLQTKNQAAIDAFFVRYAQLEDQRRAYLEANDSEDRQRSVLLVSFLPTLLQRLKRQQVRQTVSAQVGADLTLVTPLLENASLLHAVDQPARSAIDDFLALETQGLSADIFFADDVDGAVDQADILVRTIDYREGGATLPANPAGGTSTISGVWRGFLEAPDNGLYNLYVEGDAGANFSLMLDGQPITLSLDTGVWHNQDAIELRAGRLYALQLTANKVKDRLVLKWERKGMGRAPIPAERLYPALPLERFTIIYLRLLKALAIADALVLSSADLEHFAAYDDYLINGEGWLNALPAAPSSDGATAQALLRNVFALLRYRALKETWKVRDERLLELLQDRPRQAQTAWLCCNASPAGRRQTEQHC